MAIAAHPRHCYRITGCRRGIRPLRIGIDHHVMLDAVSSWIDGTTANDIRLPNSTNTGVKAKRSNRKINLRTVRTRQCRQYRYRRYPPARGGADGDDLPVPAVVAWP